MYGLNNEGDEYRRRRQELLEAEIALRDQRERVAELRRKLPAATPVDDYVFLEGPPDLHAGDAPIREVRLSELFDDPGKPLVLVHFMFSKKQAQPCPMWYTRCWADGYDGVVPHL